MHSGDLALLRSELTQAYPGSRLTRLGLIEQQRLVAKHPGVPTDYVSFLAEVGHGAVGDHFTFYSGLVGAADIFGKPAPSQVEGILFAGDNLAGYHVGFEERTWHLVSLDHATLDVERHSCSFPEWVHAELLA